MARSYAARSVCEGFSGRDGLEATRLNQNVFGAESFELVAPCVQANT